MMMLSLPATGYIVAAAFVAGAFCGWKAMDYIDDAEEAAALEVSIDMLDRTHKNARAVEKAHAKRLNAIAKKFTQENEDAKAETDRLIAAVHAGELKLYAGIHQQNRTGDRGVEGGTSACPSGDNGSPGTDILEESAASFLIAESVRADKIVRQLTACQAALVSDRKGR